MVEEAALHNVQGRGRWWCRLGKGEAAAVWVYEEGEAVAARPCLKVRGAARRRRRRSRRWGRTRGRMLLLRVNPVVERLVVVVQMRKTLAARNCLSSLNGVVSNVVVDSPDTRFQKDLLPTPIILSPSLSSLSTSSLMPLRFRCAYSTDFHSCTSRTRSSLRKYSSTFVGRAGS